jgi:hypothetical protein
MDVWHSNSVSRISDGAFWRCMWQATCQGYSISAYNYSQAYTCDDQLLHQPHRPIGCIELLFILVGRLDRVWGKLLHCRRYDGFSSVITAESHYLLTAAWMNKLYTVYGTALLTLSILLVVSSVLTSTMIFCLLFIGDYRWWWRSFLCGGAGSLMIFVDSLYFYVFHSEMSGMFQTSFYFGQMLIFCYTLFLALGTFSLMITYLFLRCLYRNKRSD